MKKEIGFGIEIEIFDHMTITNNWNESEVVV
jgi:hypothetical protein